MSGHDRRLVQHLAKKSMATIAVARVGLEAGQQVVDAPGSNVVKPACAWELSGFFNRTYKKLRKMQGHRTANEFGEWIMVHEKTSSSKLAWLCSKNGYTHLYMPLLDLFHWNISQCPCHDGLLLLIRNLDPGLSTLDPSV